MGENFHSECNYATVISFLCSECEEEDNRLREAGEAVGYLQEGGSHPYQEHPKGTPPSTGHGSWHGSG